MLLTVKSNQKTLYRQIGAQFQGKRHIPFPATDQEQRHGRHTTWELSAKEAPEHIKANWPGSAWRGRPPKWWKFPGSQPRRSRG